MLGKLYAGVTATEKRNLATGRFTDVVKDKEFLQGGVRRNGNG
jgi:hypothetical protein